MQNYHGMSLVTDIYVAADPSVLVYPSLQYYHGMTLISDNCVVANSSIVVYPLCLINSFLPWPYSQFISNVGFSFIRLFGLFSSLPI